MWVISAVVLVSIGAIGIFMNALDWHENIKKDAIRVLLCAATFVIAFWLDKRRSK